MSEPTSANDSRTAPSADNFAALSSALEAIGEWPVGSAAAAVIGAGSGGTDGSVGAPAILATYGDTGEVFELASVTKLLTAAAVLLAVEEGAFEADTPAGPEGSTVRHLLAHASGLAFDSREVKAAPGEKRIYSSAGYEVLAELVEAEAGMGFAEYLAEGVGGGLGMTATVLDGSAGHGARGSVADLALLASEMLDPRLLSAETWDDAKTTQFSGINGLVPGFGMQKPCPWGLGPEIKGEKSPHWTGKRNSASTYGHFGQSGTFLWVDPEATGGPLALVVLTDRAFGDWAKPLWPALSDAVVDAAAGR
ncbi:serine hydrolase domain-containing protein [Dietzia sp.]|uniref:serine hydrolase domain-containing protein n=1 Tax=Dietzia sp. TaxID=1871616 RepID=UPI002FDB5188